mgnify:CR=1 FL=1
MHTSEPLENTPFFAAIQKGEWEFIALALAARPRATFTAADYWAEGLYFVDVQYPEQFVLPREPLGPLFLNGVF